TKNHIDERIATGKKSTLTLVGGSGDMEFWKDQAGGSGLPTAAVSFGMAQPGGSSTNDMVFSAWNGSSWSERMRMTNGGNVGIGTTSPAGTLHIRGANPVRILGETTTLSGSESVDFFARTSASNSDLGGMRIQRGALTGDIDTLIFAKPSGSSAREMVRVSGNGNVGIDANVGIGTNTPLQKLHLYGANSRLRLQSTQRDLWTVTEYA